jgi:hypothetical protein
MMRRERHNLDAPAAEETVGGDEECIWAFALEHAEGLFDFAAGAGLEHLNFQSKSACGFWCLASAIGGRQYQR